MEDIFFTSKMHLKHTDDERTEFSLSDSSGNNEKIISLRLLRNQKIEMYLKDHKTDQLEVHQKRLKTRRNNYYSEGMCNTKFNINYYISKETDGEISRYKYN